MSRMENIDNQYIVLILQKMKSANLLRTAEGVAVWLTVVQLFPETTLPKSVWHHNDPLASKERSVLSKLLRDNVSADINDSDTARSQTGIPQNTPSFAWSIVLSEFFRRYQVNLKESIFTKFWVEAVDSKRDHVFTLSRCLTLNRWLLCFHFERGAQVCRSSDRLYGHSCCAYLLASVNLLPEHHANHNQSEIRCIKFTPSDGQTSSECPSDPSQSSPGSRTGGPHGDAIRKWRGKSRPAY